MSRIKIIMIFTLILNFSFVFGQDDEEFDPKPKPFNPNPTPFVNPINPYADIVGNLPSITLQNYIAGDFYHVNILQFCNLITTYVDKCELEGKKIIGISIKGYADGIVNTGFSTQNKNIHSDCLKYLNYNQGAEDIALAQLRACQIEGYLKEQLKSKSYFVSINTTNTYYDEPDGGNIGGSFRKVEVIISYLKEKNK